MCIAVGVLQWQERSMLKLSLAMLASALMLSPAAAQQVGAWMLAPSPLGGYLVPGKVSAVSGQSVTLTFDGASRTHLLAELQPLAWTVASKIECGTAGGDWQDVTITALGAGDGTLTIRQDTDAVVRGTTFAGCRVPQYP